MRWPSPLAQTAQPERWRMRRWSKEPRRMSVVEGRVVASLARALSVRFIYIHETARRWPCQEFSKHFEEILFFRFGARLPAHRVRPGRNDDARLSAVARQKIRGSRQGAKNAKNPPRFPCVPCALARYDFSRSEWSTPSQRIRAYCLEIPHSLPSGNFLFSFQSGGSAR